MRFVIVTLFLNILFFETFIVLCASESTGKPEKQPNEHKIYAPIPWKKSDSNLIQELEKDAEAHQAMLARQRPIKVPQFYQAARSQPKPYFQKSEIGKSVLSKEAGPSKQFGLYHPIKPYKKSELYKQNEPYKQPNNSL